MADVVLFLTNGTDNLVLTTGDNLLLASTPPLTGFGRAELVPSSWVADLVPSSWRADLQS